MFVSAAFSWCQETKTIRSDLEAVRAVVSSIEPLSVKVQEHQGSTNTLIDNLQQELHHAVDKCQTQQRSLSEFDARQELLSTQFMALQTQLAELQEGTKTLHEKQQQATKEQGALEVVLREGIQGLQVHFDEKVSQLHLPILQKNGYPKLQKNVQTVQRNKGKGCNNCIDPKQRFCHESGRHKSYGRETTAVLQGSSIRI